MIQDTGRARAFYQSASEDVDAAVLSCPVHCMHYVSFDELKELEIARDDGDGRTDHRHPEGAAGRAAGDGDLSTTRDQRCQVSICQPGNIQQHPLCR